jgi:hypothetical protein
MERIVFKIPIVVIIKAKKDNTSVPLGRGFKFLLICKYVYRPFQCSHSFISSSLRFSVSEEHLTDPPISVCVPVCRVFQPSLRNYITPRACLPTGLHCECSFPTVGFHPRSCPSGALSPGPLPLVLPHIGALPTKLAPRIFAPLPLGFVLAGLKTAGILPVHVRSPRPWEHRTAPEGLGHLRWLHPLGTPPGNAAHGCSQPGLKPLGL